MTADDGPATRCFIADDQAMVREASPLCSQLSQACWWSARLATAPRQFARFGICSLTSS